VRRALAFERAKFWSIRSTVWTLVAAGLVSPVFAVVVAATGSLQPDDTILGASLTAAGLAQVMAAVVGALTMTSEYGSGSIQPTLLAQPKRGTVLVAKAVVVAESLFVMALVSCAAAFGLGRLLLDGDAHATGDPWPALLGIAATLAAGGVLGLALGAIVRRSAGTVAAVVGVFLLPSLVAPLFGDLERWIGGASPAAALEKLTQSSDATPEMVGSIGGWPSLGLAVGLTLVVLAVSGRLLAARDA
jgi:ABC-2 type transport system permease protein